MLMGAFALGASAWLNLRSAWALESQTDALQVPGPVADNRDATPVQLPEPVLPLELRGARADSAEVLARLQSAAERTNVLITRVDVSAPVAGPPGWERMSFRVSASAEYAAAKAWLAEVQARVPAANVVQLRLERKENAPTAAHTTRLEVTAMLALWLRKPATASAEGS
jgi:hypothetical protein